MQVHIGNITGMDVEYINNSILHSKMSNTVFKLDSLMHAPNMTKKKKIKRKHAF